MTQRTSPKTPYEIRLELLQLAFDILRTQHQAAGIVHANGAHIATTAATTEQVVAEAEKMNTFISKGNQ